MPRLFVAVWPPPDVVERVAAVPRPSLPGLRWTDPAQWHVTLRFLGRVHDAAPVEEALADVVAAPVEAVVGPEVGRFGQRVLHVPVGGLGDLAAAVASATAALGEPPEDRAFSGHLTLARVRRGARVDLRPLAGATVEGRWPVTEFT
ncbi:MAG: RNA 2',3'-cyclic phosphodiesterase, partial [Actinomycetota bacterium]|nr:RNA 2',3'-cyclic phosphodiesterase [Actinomycetota bacterium]